MGGTVTTPGNILDKTGSSKNKQIYSTQEETYFTAKQKKLVRETWSKIHEHQTDMGVEIFLKLFQLKPETKTLFPFRDLDGDTLLSDATFRSHATRFMFAIGSTVSHLDALDVSCGTMFVLLGRKHTWIPDFPESGYLEAFTEAVAIVFEDKLGKNGNREVYVAWRAVFGYIAGKMIEGYNEAKKDEHKK